MQLSRAAICLAFPAAICLGASGIQTPELMANPRLPVALKNYRRDRVFGYKRGCGTGSISGF
jgi:hypothetical protein